MTETHAILEKFKDCKPLGDDVISFNGLAIMTSKCAVLRPAPVSINRIGSTTGQI